MTSALFEVIPFVFFSLATPYNKAPNALKSKLIPRAIVWYRSPAIKTVLTSFTRLLNKIKIDCEKSWHSSTYKPSNNSMFKDFDDFNSVKRWWITSKTSKSLFVFFFFSTFSNILYHFFRLPVLLTDAFLAIPKYCFNVKWPFGLINASFEPLMKLWISL